MTFREQVEERLEEVAGGRLTWIAPLLLSPPPMDGPIVRVARSGLLFILALWGGVIVLGGIDAEASGRGFLHLVNLPFHEAGHLIFRIFGSFMASLGGPLGQLLMPLICGGTLLLKTRDAFGASVSLWWMSESLIDLGPYIADARAGVLPLLGGNTGHSAPYGFHDFEYLLTETGLLGHDVGLAWFAHGLGSLGIALAILWGGVLLLDQWREARS